MKYKKITGNIFTDFQIHLGSEGLFCIAFFKHKSNKNQRRKIYYIWDRLIKIYGRENETNKDKS